MNTLIRFVLVVMLAALPFKSMALMTHSESPAAVSEHVHCGEHGAIDALPDSSGTQCGEHCDCCLGSGLPVRDRTSLPEQLPSTPSIERESSLLSFITSAPERPPRAHLA